MTQEVSDSLTDRIIAGMKARQEQRELERRAKEEKVKRLQRELQQAIRDLNNEPTLMDMAIEEKKKKMVEAEIKVALAGAGPVPNAYMELMKAKCCK